MQQHTRTAAVAVLAAVPAAAGDSVATARAILADAAGQTIGEVRFEQAPKGVILQVDASGLPPGSHGIHLHATGSCAPDFKAAKGHVNPAGASHGLRHPEGPDSGDLPNLFVAADGSARAEFYTTRVALAAAGDLPALLDADGAAVIVHANPDDHRSQPIGGAGGRIACGVITADEDAAPRPSASP